MFVKIKIQHFENFQIDLFSILLIDIVFFFKQSEKSVLMHI